MRCPISHVTALHRGGQPRPCRWRLNAQAHLSTSEFWAQMRCEQRQIHCLNPSAIPTHRECTRLRPVSTYSSALDVAKTAIAIG